MKVIMLNDIRHTGRRGEIVDVKSGFARNYLLPKGLAALANNSNVSWFEQQKSKIEAELAAERHVWVELAAQIDGSTIEIRKRAGENDTLYGSVTPIEVTEALASRGFEVDRRAVDLTGGIKELGDHPVRIELHSEVSAQITVRVLPES